jgi:hypothetical protein
MFGDWKRKCRAAEVYAYFILQAYDAERRERGKSEQFQVMALQNSDSA